MKEKTGPALSLALMVPVFWLLATANFSSAGVPAANTEVNAEYVEGGTQICLLCHGDDHALGILQTPHFTSADPRSPGEQHACQSCHGPAAAHVANPLQIKPLVFGSSSSVPVERQNAVCLGCHESGERNDWHASTHAGAGLACTSCHAVHNPRQAVLDRDTQAGVCFSCHLEKRQAFRRRSHHPLEEGLVGCADCHNAHGGPGHLQVDSINDTCFLCHAEKRGPFLWEHPPVTDSCTNCHNPHGSVQPTLLQQRPPFLCQQCHSNNYHPGTLYSGTGLPDNMPANKLLGSGCINCHSQVHGSNHPSGNLLTR